MRIGKINRQLFPLVALAALMVTLTAYLAATSIGGGGGLLGTVAVIAPAGAEYHWTFDAVNGGFVTDTVRGLNGTVSNASIQGAAQVGNGALAITGADNSFVSFPKAYPGLEGYFRTPSFTIAFWVKTSSTTPVMDLVGNRRSAGCESYVQLRMRGHHPQGNDGGIYANISQDQSCTGAIEVSSKGHAYNDGA